MSRSVRAHFHKHARFYTAAIIGLAAGIAAAEVAPRLEIVAAADTFFAVYLVLMTVLVVRATPAKLRRMADVEDEGIVVIVVIALAAVVISLASIFLLFAEPGKPGAVELYVTLASAPLGWLMLHTVVALHYAHRFYGGRMSTGIRHEAGGLRFPDTDEPHAWDFIYHAFTIGMTAQVSDVCAVSTRMRQVVLVHAFISFVFNTILIALAVNAAVELGH